MSKRRKDPISQRSTAIYDEAFQLQVGEYHPEHHEANIRTLRARYPEYSAKEVDGIYRQACRIEYEIEQWVGGLQLSAGSREELMDWLEDRFFGFTGKSFSWAIERIEEKQV